MWTHLHLTKRVQSRAFPHVDYHNVPTIIACAVTIMFTTLQCDLCAYHKHNALCYVWLALFVHIIRRFVIIIYALFMLDMGA